MERRKPGSRSDGRFLGFWARLNCEEKPDFSAFSHDELLIFHALSRKADGDPKWDEHIRHWGSEMYQRMYPNRLVTAFVKALPFGEEPWRTLPQNASAGVSGPDAR